MNLSGGVATEDLRRALIGGGDGGTGMHINNFSTAHLKEGMTENKADQYVAGVHIYPAWYFIME